VNRWALVTAVVIAGFLATPLLVRPASAADVPTTLIAFQVTWHVGTHTTPPAPTISVNPGDVLRLRIENHDNQQHTFTFPHFAVNTSLNAGSPTTPFVAFVNITTAPADNGKWQFYCAIPGHAPGTDESRTGMVGWVQVGVVRPPPTPGFEVVLVIAALGTVALAARVLPRRK
jgi:uncharacterized cupredoxin-like copper-binding protein